MNPTRLFLVTGLIGLCTSCATIVSKTKYPVTVDSTPRQAMVSITDRRGKEVYSGNTPTLVHLKSGAGFFQKGQYKVTISKPGYQDKTVTLKAGLNGWYFGNLVLGGLVGLLIVDPATGAMYRIKTTDVNETLEAATTTTSATGIPKLQVYDINQIPAHWKNKLELLVKK